MLISSVLLALSLAQAQAVDDAAGTDTSSATWESTIDRVSKGVVALNVTAVRDFDSESAGSSRGTGFIVDADRGLILTNRHMVHAGPVVAEAVLLNNEEIELEAIYRDPVHDFGFYRFDPSDVKYMDLVELELDPDGARVGKEIRVVGNDAGEKLSILDGTLARLDREAPFYGGDTYNDFNTFYIQAASSTSGGSSGSPVVDLDGKVVALNAGGSMDAASSFYLPLNRVVRALESLQKGEIPARGALQATFEHRPYDELQRLGLQDATADAYRRWAPDNTGMLVVADTVPGGPAEGVLEPGDILVALEGERLNSFIPLESALDSNVGGTVALTVQRNGEELEFELTVGDLHAISAAEYLEFGRGVLHPVDYHTARNHVLPVEGVYVALPGYVLRQGGISDRAIITHLDGVAVPDLDTLQAELETKAPGHLMQVRWHSVQEPTLERVGIVPVNRTWYPMQRCVRDDTTGRWPCTAAAPALPAVEPEPAEALFYADGSKAARKLARSLVMVEFDIPHPTAGVKGFAYVGAGVVVDAERGFVLVDRDTVPVTLGDLRITFGGTVRVPARLAYLHPVHNFAILQYDPSRLADTEVTSAQLRPTAIDVGDTLYQVGLNSKFQLIDHSTDVMAFDTVPFNPSQTPRYRDANAQVVEVTTADPSMGGVLADKRGRVVALWASYMDQRDGERSFWGLPAATIQPVLTRLQGGEPLLYRHIGAEFLPTTLTEARDRGLSEERARELFDHDPVQRQVLEVERLTGGTFGGELLQGGDLLLEVNGAIATQALELEEALGVYSADSATVVVLRDGEELTLEVPLTPLGGTGVSEIVNWAGMILHEPHFEVSAQRGVEPEGLYVSWLWYGSPSARYGFLPTRRIVEVNGVPTPDMAAFIAATEGLEDGSAVRVKLLDLDDRTTVRTFKHDLHYWPTSRFQLTESGWSRVE